MRTFTLLSFRHIGKRSMERSLKPPAPSAGSHWARRPEKMNRRTFLLSGGVALLAPGALLACPAGEVPASNGCTPEFADQLQGDRQVVLKHRPKLCLSDDVYRLMTRNARGRKTTEARWDYAFWHGGRNAPYDIGREVIGRCFSRQRVKHGTTVINWFNCKEIKNRSWTGRWVRYWSATRPITNSGKYELRIYHREYVEGFESKPPRHSRWPLPK